MVDALGIDVYKVFMLVFGIGAMAAGFAGIVNAPVVSIAPDVGEAILVQTFVVVVIGGVGSFPGAVLGGLIAGEIISITSMFNPGYSYVDAVRRDDAGARAAALWAARRGRPRVSAAHHAQARPFLVEALTAIGLIVAPFVLPHLGFSPTTINRILIWGLFGLGFDILFGFTGLLSFGQSAFFGTGGMVAAYLLTQMDFTNVMLALVIGMLAAAVVGFLVGLIALRRTGIYFAMITVAIAEVFFFVEFSPLSDYHRRRERPARRAAALVRSRLHDVHVRHGLVDVRFLAFWFFIGLVIARRIVRSPVGAILRAIRDNPLRAAAVGHNIHSYKLTAFVVAAAYAGFAGGLLGLMQGFMPPDAFMFDTSGQLVMQTAIGGAGTLFGPLVGAAIWLYLSDFFQNTLHLGSDLEAGARRRVRAAGDVPAPRRHRRRQGSLRAGARRQRSRTRRRRIRSQRRRRRARASRRAAAAAGARAAPAKSYSKPRG